MNNLNKGGREMKRVDLYGGEPFKFNINDKVTWNNKIFKECPFNIDTIKEVEEISFGNIIELTGINMQWNWWEVVPTNIFKKPVYWIKFYYWYYTRFKKL